MDSRQQCRKNYREKAERGRLLGEEREEKKGGGPEAVRRRGKEPDKKDWSTHWKKMTTPGADIRGFLWMTEARLISARPGKVVGAQNRIHTEDSWIKKLQDQMIFFGRILAVSGTKEKKGLCAVLSGISPLLSFPDICPFLLLSQPWCGDCGSNRELNTLGKTIWREGWKKMGWNRWGRGG